MKRVLFLSLIVIVAFVACKKKKIKGCMDPTATNYNAKATESDGSCQFPVTPAPTMNFITFTLNGPGMTNKKFTYSKAKNFVQLYEYSETTAGVIYAMLDMMDKSSGDTLVQIRFDDKITGNKPFSTSAVFIKLVNINTGFQSSSTIGAFNITAFTPTQLVTNMTSGTVKGKFVVEATFSGTLEEDNTGDTWTIKDGVVKFDGN